MPSIPLLAAGQVPFRHSGATDQWTASKPAVHSGPHMRPVSLSVSHLVRLYHTTRDHVNSGGYTKRAERCRSAL